MSSTEESNWENLPPLALFMILEKVTPLSDFLRFSAVCKIWRKVALDDPKYARQRFETCSQQVPFLIVPIDEANAKKKRQGSLYTLSGHKLPNFQLSLPYNIMSCGTPHGWLVIYNERVEQLEITLYNPFSHKNIINIPPINIQLSPYVLPQFLLQKVILSTNPSVSPDDFYIAVLHHNGKLSILKYNQKSWKYIDLLGERLFADIIFHKGLLYVVDRYYDIMSVDFIRILNKDGNNKFRVISGFQASPTGCKYRYVIHLVESSRGDLFMVRRSFTDFCSESNKETTATFEVFKVILGGNNGAIIDLVELNSLGGDALFVGGNHSSSVSVLDFPRCQPDSIYFADHFLNFIYSRSTGHQGPRDVGVYNMKNGDIERHHELCYANDLPLPIWITPTPSGLC